MGNSIKKGYWKGGRYISFGKTGYWSKYGGGKLYKHMQEENKDWYCQSCGDLQFPALPSFLIKTGENEYVKVCVFCRFAVAKYDIIDIRDLQIVMRKPDTMAYIANLLTLPLRF